MVSTYWDISEVIQYLFIHYSMKRLKSQYYFEISSLLRTMGILYKYIYQSHNVRITTIIYSINTAKLGDYYYFLNCIIKNQY